MTEASTSSANGFGRRRFLRLSAGTAGAAVAAAALAGCSGAVDAATEDAPADEPSVADLGFLTDMSAHHSQALVMCHRVFGQDVGTPVTAAAAEVLQNQAIELGMMRAWLADWGASTAPPELVMAWMGMGDGDGMPLAMMPGLATDAELQELSMLEGLAQGRRWLELMLTHHVGGVAMAEAAATMAASDKVIRLAQTQAEVQTFEIAQYEQLLATTYDI